MKRENEEARWLKETILRLGPTFIKIGQQFSTRVDILAQEYVDQLSELQVIAEYLQKIDPKSDGAKRDWVAIYDEQKCLVSVRCCWIFSGSEIDYTMKLPMQNCLQVTSKNMDYVKVPSIYWEYTTPQVLTMEYVPGIKINRIEALDQLGVDRKRLGGPASKYSNGYSGAYWRHDCCQTNLAMLFLNSFEERLAAQRREREMAQTELGFKKPLSKEEQKEKKKQRLAAIGEDLLAIAADQPFRFPATFTFVVRAFSGTSVPAYGCLDPRFDITEIAKPYALELLRFREAGVEDFRNRWDRQSAFYNLFRQADRVEKLAAIIQRLVDSMPYHSFKLKFDHKSINFQSYALSIYIYSDLLTGARRPEAFRVRAFEAERAFQRVSAVQKTIGSAVAAGSLVNLATVLYLNSVRIFTSIHSLCILWLQVLFGLLKVNIRGMVPISRLL
ncbi:hypothetical protein HAX54_022563 [Datura stramonium]|uniref:ABC1 atypical kinase-like domain-containing protein n=1 Tax=Datura stramonium TaxID=4076 RepID=A0ABS8UWM6_DATST|nr:hypothetical protein [Datura stramonium]